MGWRSGRQAQRELRRASRQAKGALISTINLVGLGVGLAAVVIAIAATAEVPPWITVLTAMLASVPTVVGLRQLPDAYRKHRDAKRRLSK